MYYNLFQEEQETNYNTISNLLFNSNYQDNIDSFVFFPIDLEIDEQLNFKFKNKPIFNRSWFETDNFVLCLFPTQNADDLETLQILDEELPNIKSLNNPDKQVYFRYIDTTEFHRAGVAGGNLHCLIKQQFKTK